MYKKTIGAFVAVLFLSLVGCASIRSGSSQLVNFDSMPSGAKVTMDGRVLGVTPFSASVPRQSSAVFTFEKAGYKSRVFQASVDMNPWFLGNLLTGGPLGTTTDAVTGSLYKYDPGQITVILAKD